VTRPQRRWHLLAWLAIVPIAVAALLLADAQRDGPAGLGAPATAEEPR